MFFSDKSEVQNLNFLPRGHCLSKARVEWNNIILNGKVAENQPIIDLSQENLHELCFDLFGPLTFIETFELFRALKKKGLAEALDWGAYLQLNQMSWNQRIQQIFSILDTAPPEFLQWCYEKKISARDLTPLVPLKTMTPTLKLWNGFSSEQLSRSEGKQALDWLVDLILMDVDLDELSPQQKWLEKIRLMRFPQTTQSDSRPEQNNPWPKFVHIVKQRQGDRLIRRMQIDFQDSRDLVLKLSKISKIENHNYE